MLEHELIQHQDQELATNLQNLQYSIERVDTLDRWARVQAKMDTLTPSDGRIRFWVLSDDPRFQYGKGLAAMQNMVRNDDGTGTIALPSVKAPIRTMSRDIEPLKDRPAVRLIVGSDSGPYRHTLHDFLIALVALSLTSILAVMAIGYWIARVGLRPLKHLSVEARALRPKATRSACRPRTSRSSWPTSRSPSTAPSAASKTPIASSRPSTPTSRTSCARRSPT